MTDKKKENNNTTIAVYGTLGISLSVCKNQDCLKKDRKYKKKKKNQEFCTLTCKNAFHKKARIIGEELLNKKIRPSHRILKLNEKLQQAYRVLKIGWLTTIEFESKLPYGTVAPGNIRSELKRNKVIIEKRYNAEKKLNEYKIIGNRF